MYREKDGHSPAFVPARARAPSKGFADDYAFLIQGLLDLYEADFEPQRLDWAERLQAKQDELFADPAGGYFGTSQRDASVLLRLKEDHDGAEPAASSVSVLNLARLAAITGREEYRKRAERNGRGIRRGGKSPAHRARRCR